MCHLLTLIFKMQISLRLTPQEFLGNKQNARKNTGAWLLRGDGWIINVNVRTNLLKLYLKC